MTDDEKRRDIQKLEYSAAQEMLRHYDALNWQIGAALIAATTIFTGLVLQKDVIDRIQDETVLSCVIIVGVPLFSGFILSTWYRWFKRHRDLYNFRNETLHRIELRLGMFHHLRVVHNEFVERKAKSIKNLTEAEYQRRMEVLGSAQKRADEDFEPFYKNLKLSEPSGFALALHLTCGIPLFQFVILLAVKFLA